MYSFIHLFIYSFIHLFIFQSSQSAKLSAFLYVHLPASQPATHYASQ